MKKALFLILVLFAVSNSFSQNAIWKKITTNEVNAPVLARDSQPTEFLLYSLNLDALKAKLATAPSRNVVGQESNLIVVEDFNFETPNTKNFISVLKALGLENKTLESTKHP